MANFIELKDYRSKIMKILINDANICSILLGRTIVDTDDADMQDEIIDKQIYRYAYVPSVGEEAKTYICYELKIVKSGMDSNRSRVSLMFYIFSHKADIKDKLTNYLKTDLLDERIQFLFNENADFGIGKVQCTRNDPLKVGDDYYGRNLQFDVSDLTTNRCK